MTFKDNSTLPLLDLNKPLHIETATFARGCFWTPEARFGAEPGIVRTRVGYAGGTSPEPTYRSLGDHIETIQVDFDPSLISFKQLLIVFFLNHRPTSAPRKRQYASALFYHSPEQLQNIEEAIKEMESNLGQELKTEVLPYKEFYLAEERHQKWKLRRVPELLAELEAIYPDFIQFNQSTAVARVNGYVTGFGQESHLLEDLPALGLSYFAQNLLLNQFQIQEKANQKNTG